MYCSAVRAIKLCIEKSLISIFNVFLWMLTNSMKKLTDKEKQEIRDEIDRLKHLKEPYVIWLQVLISISVAVFIFMAGSLDSQVDRLKVTSNYSIEIFENFTNNATPQMYGSITPKQDLNFVALNTFLNNLWATLAISFLFILGLIVYSIKYVKYDQKINQLYNVLIGMEKSKITPVISKTEINKKDLESLFQKYQYTLLVLSIFLLITVEFVGKQGYLNNVMALLSALIAYFLLVGIDMPLDKKRQTIPLFGFSVVFPIFIVTFCAWTILNIVITLDGEKSKVVWILVWLFLMLYPGIKSIFKKDKSS